MTERSEPKPIAERSGSEVVTAESPNPPEIVDPDKSFRAVVARIWGEVKEHLALILGALATVIIAAKVLYVARFDPSVAMAIVQAGGAASIVGIVVQLLPIAVGGLAALFVASAVAVVVVPRVSPRRAADDAAVRVDHGEAFLIGVAAVAAWFLAPLSVLGTIFGLVVGFPLAFALFDRFRGAKKEKPKESHDRPSSASDWPEWLTVLAGVAAMLFVGQLFVTGIEGRGMWLPAERVTYAGRTVVGYVLSSETAWTTLLVDEDASLLRIRTSTVRSRIVCSISDSGLWERSLQYFAQVESLFPPDATPPCSSEVP